MGTKSVSKTVLQDAEGSRRQTPWKSAKQGTETMVMQRKKRLHAPPHTHSCARPPTPPQLRGDIKAKAGALTQFNCTNLSDRFLIHAIVRKHWKEFFSICSRTATLAPLWLQMQQSWTHPVSLPFCRRSFLHCWPFWSRIFCSSHQPQDYY